MPDFSQFVFVEYPGLRLKIFVAAAAAIAATS